LRWFLARESEHVVGHVQAVSPSRRTDTFCREQNVDAAAGPKIEHDLAGLEFGQGRGVPAAERSQHCFLRQAALLSLIVEV
jgi:hypothetical protein